MFYNLINTWKTTLTILELYIILPESTKKIILLFYIWFIKVLFYLKFDGSFQSVLYYIVTIIYTIKINEKV